jgi:hypothetical protein
VIEVEGLKSWVCRRDADGWFGRCSSDGMEMTVVVICVCGHGR